MLVMKRLILVLGLCVCLASYANSAPTTHQFHHPEKFLAKIKDDPKVGEKVF